MTRRQYAGGAAATTITTPIASAGGGTVGIAVSTGWPDGAVGKFHIVVDPGNSSEEKILVDLRSGTTLTFSSGGRGADGTASTSHAAGASIWLCYTALDADEANAHVNSALNAHAATSIYFAPVGTIAATNVQSALTELDSESGARLTAIEANDWVTAARIIAGAVGSSELATDSVITAKILDANVTAAKLAADAVTTVKILDANVTTAKVADNAITFAKLGPAAVSRWSTATPLTVVTSTVGTMTWTTETEDDLSMAAPSFTTITMPTGSDGLWAVTLTFTVSSGSLGTSGFVDMLVNGSTSYGQSGRVQSAGTYGFTWTPYLVATNTIALQAGNLSGANAIISAAALTLCRLAKIA